MYRLDVERRQHGSTSVRGSLARLMWPWDHVAIGYLAYSLLVRLFAHRPPAAGGAIAVVLGTQVPDLIDKPLGWGTTMLPSGQSLGHSLLFAVPLILVVLVLTRGIDRTEIGAAFGIGYLSHLPGDVVYPALLGGDLNVSFLLWPLAPASGSQPTTILAHVQELLMTFTDVLATPQGAYYLGFEAALLLVTATLWVLDGRPGLPAHSPRARGGHSE